MKNTTEHLDALRAKVKAELAAGQQVDFFEALLADPKVTRDMLVVWMLGPAQAGVKAERTLPALLRVAEAAQVFIDHWESAEKREPMPPPHDAHATPARPARRPCRAGGSAMKWTTTTRGRTTRSEAKAGRGKLGAYTSISRPNEWFWYLNDGNETLKRGYAPTLAAAQQAAEHALAGLPAGVKP